MRIQRTSNTEALSWILKETSVDPRVVTGSDGGTLLHAIAQQSWALRGRSGIADSFLFLLDAGCDVNAKTGSGESVLHYAVIAENLKCVDLLLSRGAFVNAVNRSHLLSSFFFPKPFVLVQKRRNGITLRHYDGKPKTRADTHARR